MSSYEIFNGANSPMPDVVQFTLQSGATPIHSVGGNIIFDAAGVASNGNPVETFGVAPNTMVLNVQNASAAASSSQTNAGLASFSNADFVVDANGFVTLVGGSAAIAKINMQTGTSPIVSAAGVISLNGAVVSAGTNPVRTDGTGANTGAIEVQISQAIAATDATKIGLSNYNSAQFTVDANGFVGFVGSSTHAAILGVHPNATSGGGTDPTLADASGNISILAASVAAGTNPIRSVATAANSLTIQAQISQAIVATDATKVGLAAFNSAEFSVDANGFVSLLGTDAIQTITGNSGGAESPLAGNFNILGTGSITVAGSANTGTVQLTGLTNHAIQIGAGTATLTQLAATATTGQVLQNNNAADPSWSTATYPSVATGTGTILRADGTNWVATTATYPATTTSQQILYSSAANVVGQLTTANSAIAATNSSGTLAMRAFSVKNQVFTGSGTYTPTTGMLYCIIRLVGGGGGGGGIPVSNSPAGTAVSGGGGGGGYAEGAFSSATIGANQTVTIGAAGLAGAAGSHAGGTGGTTSVGGLLSATGGVGGGAGLSSATGLFIAGGAGGAGTGGDIQITGASGGQGLGFGATIQIAETWPGGASQLGQGGVGVNSNSGGNAGTQYGGGGSGGASNGSGSTFAGGAGFAGVVIVTEYIIA